MGKLTYLLASVLLCFGLVSLCGAQSGPPSEEALKSAAQSNPNDFRANYLLGELYLHTGRIADGLPWMEKAVAANPQDYVAGYDLALAYHQTHQPEKARRQLQRMLKLQDTADLHSLRADVEESAGNYLAAAREYQTAAQLDPTDENIFDWATDLISHHNYAPAITVLSRGIELYPRSLRMSVGLGVALYLDEQYDRAMKQLCAATDLQPSETWPYLFLGTSYTAMASRLQTAEVAERLKRFAALEPNNPKALYSYAMTLWNREAGAETQNAEAQSLLERAVALDPAFSDAHLQLGMMYADQGQSEKAIHQLSSALRLAPELATAHYHLAQQYSKTGQKDLAKAELETFRQLRAHESEQTRKERDRVLQFMVNMKEPR